jgi:hypothetical protein
MAMTTPRGGEAGLPDVLPGATPRTARGRLQDAVGGHDQGAADGVWPLALVERTCQLFRSKSGQLRRKVAMSASSA